MRNRGHGTTDSLSIFSGIEINVEMLTGITIQPDKKTATLQAGTFAGDVINELWDQGFVTSKRSVTSLKSFITDSEFASHWICSMRWTDGCGTGWWPWAL